MKECVEPINGLNSLRTRLTLSLDIREFFKSSTQENIDNITVFFDN